MSHTNGDHDPGLEGFLDSLDAEAEPMQSPNTSGPKWQRILRKEMGQRDSFRNLPESEWRNLLKSRRVTSANHDTVLSLDWPHYCVGASDACGGSRGYCYTFTGLLSGDSHIRKVAMVDALATWHPELFAERVVHEVQAAAAKGHLPYPNLRYSGSGEMGRRHVKALRLVAERGVHLWGFTRNISVARDLREAGISVIMSCDHSTDSDWTSAAISEGFKLAYSSRNVDDVPPFKSFMVFPLHRSGRVKEVADVPDLCPKVLYEYLHQERPNATCQAVCRRCHNP